MCCLTLVQIRYWRLACDTPPSPPRAGQIRVVLGTNKLSSNNQRLDVLKVIRNANYDEATMEHDIALLKLRIDGRQEYGGANGRRWTLQETS